MVSNGIITLSSVPTDKNQAELLKAKIEAGQVTLHPEQSEEIISKLQRVLNGEYEKIEETEIKSAESDISIEFGERQNSAKEREEKRNSIRAPLKSALLSLQEAEESIESSLEKYEYQYELTKSKLAILKILKSLEQESNDFFERNLRAEF